MKPMNDILDNFSPTRLAYPGRPGSIIMQFDRAPWLRRQHPPLDFSAERVKTRIMLDVEHEDLDHE